MRFFMTDMGFEPVRMRRRRLALQSTAPLPTVLPKLPPKKAIIIICAICASFFGGKFR